MNQALPAKEIHVAGPAAPWAAALLTLALFSAGCSSPAEDAAATTASSAATVDTADSGFPVTVQSCGVDITVDHPPQRVLLLGRAGIFAILHELGVSERVVARAGAFPHVYYDADGQAAIDAIPSLGDDLDDAGHLQISHEAILEAHPDLVVGLPDGIDRARLARSGIPALEQPANCPQGAADASYEDVHDQVELYGRVFGRAEQATRLVEDLEDRVAAVRRAAGDIAQGRTAAVLYPTVGGGTTYAYGTLSMSHRQVETAGFTNVFGDTRERVFEVTVEEVIARDPDVLVLLHVDGEPGPVRQAVLDMPGADGITAVREDAILVQRFDFGEHPTPLVVDGLERLVDAFGRPA